MSSIGQQTALVAAQQELLKLKGSGRQLLEALADTGGNSSRAQKVLSGVCLQCSKPKYSCLLYGTERPLHLTACL